AIATAWFLCSHS
ncbi:putative membrane protein, partial [Vibrio parahaemolyticus V-223/04]